MPAYDHGAGPVGRRRLLSSLLQLAKGSGGKQEGAEGDPRETNNLPL